MTRKRRVSWVHEHTTEDEYDGAPDLDKMLVLLNTRTIKVPPNTWTLVRSKSALVKTLPRLYFCREFLMLSSAGIRALRNSSGMTVTRIISPMDKLFCFRPFVFRVLSEGYCRRIDTAYLLKLPMARFMLWRKSRAHLEIGLEGSGTWPRPNGSFSEQKDDSLVRYTLAEVVERNSFGYTSPS